MHKKTKKERLCLSFFCLILPLVLGTEASANLKEKDTLKENIYVPLAYYTPETSLAVGLMWVHNLSEDESGNISQVLSLLSYTLNRQTIFILEPKIYISPILEWMTKVNVQDYPSRYYGRGEVQLSEPEIYKEKLYFIESGLNRKWSEYFFINTSVAYSSREIYQEENSPYLQAELSEHSYQTQYIKLKLGFSYDTRDVKVSTRSGSYIGFHVDQFWIQTEPQKNFQRYTLEHRYFYPISDQKTLGFQTLFVGNSRKDLIFHLLNGIGGGRLLRGYYAQQYRDSHLGSLSTEFRYHFENSPWTAKAFAGVGAVASDFGQIFKTRSLGAIGVGVNYELDTKSQINLRLDLGFSESSRGVYFLYGNAF